MKFTIIITILIFALYAILFIAAKCVRPDFLRDHDSYVGWYDFLSYPARYITATIYKRREFHDGILKFHGYSGDGVQIALEKDGALWNFFLEDKNLIYLVKRLKDGDDVNVEFINILECDNDEFIDYFEVRVMNINMASR